jgi:hypothetical protein
MIANVYITHIKRHAVSCRSGKTCLLGLNQADAARFWAKVHRADGDACWIWAASMRGGRGAAGSYGQFTLWRDGRQIHVCAHRVSWVLANGSIPDDASVLHRCDVRLCVNPAHLFLGTQRDNMRDASAKGRLGVARPQRQVVSDDQVAEIVSLRLSGVKLSVLAHRFGVSKSFVSLAARGKRRSLRKVG